MDERKKVAFDIAVLIAIVIVGLLTVQAFRSRQEAARIAAAPHLTVDTLTLAYQKHSAIAGKQLYHKFIVITGYVVGIDEGLLGDGAIHMAGGRGEIECDVGGKYGDCAVGHSCTVAGMCDGIDSYGMIRLSDCRALSASEK